MNKKKLFGVLAAASMLMNSGVAVFAQEMVETTPTGTVNGVPATNVPLNSENFPDANLLNSIKNQNTTATTAGDVTSLTLGSSVQSLEGLQYLTELESFTLQNNNFIQDVDLSTNTGLTSLTLDNNGVLTSVTLPESEDLTTITVTNNKSLDGIDISSLEMLDTAYLNNNSLDEIDLTGMAFLNTLNIAGNELYQLDTTGAKRLENLNANANQIYELKVGSALDTLLANHNKLSEFDGSGLKDLTSLDLSNNMLKSVKLPTKAGTFTNLQLQQNHLASLNLKNVNFGTPRIASETVFGYSEDITATPQNLYANSTDSAVNIKEYDPNFDPDQAQLPGNKDFNSNGSFDISGKPSVGTLAQFTQSGTTLYYFVDNGTISKVTVWLNGNLVPEGNYTLSPDPVAEGMTPAQLMNTDITVEAKKGTNYTGSVIVAKANKFEGISSVEDLIVKATASGTMSKDGVTVKVSPEVLEAIAAGYYSNLVNAKYTVTQVTGTAVVEGKTYDLKFTQDTSDPSGYTWTALSTESTLREAAVIWNTAPTQVTISGEFTVTAENLSGPLTASFNDIILTGENPTVTVSNQDKDNPNGSIGDVSLDGDNSNNSDEEPGEGDELAVTLNTDGTGITAVDGKTGVYTVAATENPVDLATVVLVDGNAVDGETITYTPVKDDTGAALTPAGTPTTVDGDNKGPKDPGFYKIEVTNADDETGSVILQITGDDEGDELAVTLSGTGITAVDGKTGVYTIAATENPVDLATVVLVDGNAVDGETITYTPVKDDTGAALTPAGTPTTVDGDNKGPKDPGFYKIEVTNADSEKGSVILEITGDNEGDAAIEIQGTIANGTYTSEAVYPATLTIKVDGGDDVELTLAAPTAGVSTAEDADGGEYTVTFQQENEDNELVDTQPVDAGDYKVIVSIGEDDDKKESAPTDYTIDPLALDATGLTVAVALKDNLSVSDITDLDTSEAFEAGNTAGAINTTANIVSLFKTITITPKDGSAINVDLTATGESDKWTIKLDTAYTIDKDIKATDTLTLGTVTVAPVAAQNPNYSSSQTGVTTGTATLEIAEVVVESSTVGITGNDSYYTYNTNNANALNAQTMKVYVVKEDLMNRLYNPNSGEHFYTKDTHEKDVLVSLGWQAEGIGWVAPIESTEPVYRLYNPNAGDHHYTKDVNEKDTLVRIGWSYEGIGWYSAYSNIPTYDRNTLLTGDSVDGLEVFREYNPNAEAAGAHNYTISEVENNVLVSLGWIDEGIAWYGLK